MYSRIISSSLPTVETKHPRAQKCCPTKFCFRSPYTRARWIALLPLIYPITSPLNPIPMICKVYHHTSDKKTIHQERFFQSARSGRVNSPRLNGPNVYQIQHHIVKEEHLSMAHEAENCRISRDNMLKNHNKVVGLQKRKTSISPPSETLRPAPSADRSSAVGTTS